jgi:hypothetical protein
MMSHHRNKIKRSYNSQYISNGHTTLPSGLNNDISLRRGEEFGAPPERPNIAAALPKRKFSDVSIHSRNGIISMMHECVVWFLESGLSPPVSPSTLTIPNQLLSDDDTLSNFSRENVSVIPNCVICVVRFWILTCQCHILLQQQYPDLMCEEEYLGKKTFL